ncbi:MAG: disulfide bond formation protein B [Rhodobacterales bacterium]|nr:MAG: disulfide bond formation protein B [Rhodobacterales bacterium]
MNIFNPFSARTLIFFGWGFSVLAIAGAWTFQSLGYEPCELCYLQRVPHYTLILLGAVALLARWNWLAWPGALIAAVASGLGAYHTGVERHWWPGPASCTGGDVSGMSPDELLAQLTAAPIVRCDEIPWRLSDLIPWEALDLTMANFNALGSFVFIFVWLAAALKAGQKPGRG